MTQRDLERIAFVTRNFGRMRMAFVVACLCPPFLTMLPFKSPPKWVYIAWMAVSVMVMWGAEHWMTRRFGRVVPVEVRGPVRRLISFFVPLAGVQLWRLDERWLASGYPSLALTYIGVVTLWLAIHDWPFRRYRFAIVVIGFAGAVARMGVVTPEDLLQWQMAAAVSVILVFMAVGILDYLTLVRVFGPARRSEQVDHADTV